MKTILTLKVGSFYFSGALSLNRGKSVEYDISTLTDKEFKALCSSVNAGIIKSSVDLSTYSLVAEDIQPVTTEVVAEVVAVVEDIVIPTTPKRKTTKSKPAVQPEDTDTTSEEI